MPDSLPNPFAIADHRRKALGAFLKNRRIALNYSQAAVASKVGCDPKTISNVETGKSAVTAEILDAILDVLQATRNEIESFAESNITIGAKEFRVRTHILRGLLQGKIDARTTDIRIALSRFADEAYRQEQLSADELDRVLRGLCRDGFLKENDQGLLTYDVQLSVDDIWLVSRYAKHVCSLLLQHVMFNHEKTLGLAVKTDRIVSAHDAITTPENFYLALKAAHLTLASVDPFCSHITLGYHQSLMHMHSWCAAAVADDRRQEFHHEFATLIVTFWQDVSRAYCIDLDDDIGKQMQAAARTADDARGRLNRAVGDLKVEFGLDQSGLDYSPLGWKGSVIPETLDEITRPPS